MEIKNEYIEYIYIYRNISKIEIDKLSRNKNI